MRRAAQVFASLALLAAARPCEACAPAPSLGERVQIADESAIIAWDEAAKREHFIRRASFRAAGRDFGFLVPTPTQPELGEVDDAVFARLEEATKPEVVERIEHELVPAFLCAFPYYFMARSAGSAPMAASAPVRVLATQRVAGFDAVVLEADDAGALAAWLDQHGYASRPELAAWLAPYVSAKWKLTAFKIAADTSSRTADTSAVRMSFTTDRPFFPYREPTDQRENLPASEVDASRLLRVFFFGKERVAGSIGPERAAWPGSAIWSDHVDPRASAGCRSRCPRARGSRCSRTPRRRGRARTISSSRPRPTRGRSSLLPSCTRVRRRSPCRSMCSR